MPTASSSRATRDAGGHQRGHEPAGQRAEQRRPARDWSAADAGSAAGGSAGGARRPRRRLGRRRAGGPRGGLGRARPPGEARRWGPPAGPTVGSGLGGLGLAFGRLEIGRSHEAHPPPWPPDCHTGARPASLSPPSGLREPNGSESVEQRELPPERQAPTDGPGARRGWPEGSARASRPPRSSRATARGWRWPGRSARPALSSRSASSTRSVNRIDHGVWGGCSERERRRILKRRRTGAAVPCRQSAGRKGSRPSAPPRRRRWRPP